jgi:hypothetical protein
MSSVDWSPVRNQDRLRARIEEIAPFLDRKGEFRADDIDSLDHPRLLEILADAGALEIVRMEQHGGTPRTVYQWREAGRETLRQYRESLPTLPCGCHAHIPAGGGDTPAGTLACKFCGAVHSKTIYREAMG